MNIVQLVFLETGTYDPMYMRPYESFERPRALMTLQEITAGGRKVTAPAVSGIIGEIIRPAANPIGQISIANGWGNKRFRFFMKIVSQDLVGNNTEEYITGYTDYTGASYQTGSVDPNLRLYINNVITMRSMNVMTGVGRQTVQALDKAQHVFSYQFQPGLEDVVNKSINLQRPQDVFVALQGSNERMMSDSFLDPRTTFAQEHVKLTSRHNASPPTFFSKVMTASQSSAIDADYDMSQNEIWNNAENRLRDQVYSENNTLFELHRKTSMQEGDSFTYHELSLMCPHLANVTTIVNPLDMSALQQAPAVMPNTAGNTNGWQGQDVYTVWASMLSGAIPPQMIECMMKSVGFIAHNHTLDGSYDIRWLYAQPFGVNLDSVRLLERLAGKLRYEVLPTLIGGNTGMAFSITGHFDILGESKLEISLGGDPAVPFATPTFADALFSPMVTVGQARVRSFADTLEYYAENLNAANCDAAPAPKIITDFNGTSFNFGG